MICSSFKLPDGATVIACRHGRHQPAKCDVCEGKGAEWLCDGPARGRTRYPTKKPRTCDRKLCAKCRRKTGEDRDLCPEHYHREQGELAL